MVLAHCRPAKASSGRHQPSWFRAPQMYGNPRYTQAAVRKQIDGILHDIALGFEIGENVDGGIGDEKRLRMGRDVHDEKT